MPITAKDVDYTVIGEELANEINRVCGGKPTASVYMAIGCVLGQMECRAGIPDRPGMFKILSDVMDTYTDYAPKPASQRQ